MNKAALREVCGTAARVWSLASKPERFEHYEYVNHRWIRVIVEYNGEDPQPKRRTGDRAQAEGEFLAPRERDV